MAVIQQLFTVGNGHRYTEAIHQWLFLSEVMPLEMINFVVNFREIIGDRKDKILGLIFGMGDREVKKLVGNWGDRAF